MDFSEILDRRHTGSMKWDNNPGPLDPEKSLIPLSVADMEFRSPRPDYFEALDRWYRIRRDFPLDPAWVVPTVGVVQAVYAAV